MRDIVFDGLNGGQWWWVFSLWTGHCQSWVDSSWWSLHEEGWTWTRQVHLTLLQRNLPQWSGTSPSSCGCIGTHTCKLCLLKNTIHRPDLVDLKLSVEGDEVTRSPLPPAAAVTWHSLMATLDNNGDLPKHKLVEPTGELAEMKWKQNIRAYI